MRSPSKQVAACSRSLRAGSTSPSDMLLPSERRRRRTSLLCAPLRACRALLLAASLACAGALPAGIPGFGVLPPQREPVETPDAALPVELPRANQFDDETRFDLNKISGYLDALGSVPGAILALKTGLKQEILGDPELSALVQTARRLGGERALLANPVWARLFGGDAAVDDGRPLDALGLRAGTSPDEERT